MLKDLAALMTIVVLVAAVAVTGSAITNPPATVLASTN